MPKNNIGREIIPFTIANNSNAPQLYLYMFGTTNPDSPQNNTYYLSNLKGDCTLFDKNAVKKPYGLKTFGSKIDAFFPQLDAVRIYISTENPLLINTDRYGIPEAVSADDKAGPNYKTLWDFVEATWHDYGDRTILHVNTTQVDAFGMAFKVVHSGFDPSNPKLPLTVVSGFDSDQARSQIIRELVAAGAPWSNLVVPGLISPRALMPLKVLDAGQFPKDQLAGYITSVLLFYMTHDLTFSYSGVTYRGRVPTDGSQFLFTPDKEKDDGGNKTSKYSIKTPTTRQCYAQDIVSSPDDGVGKALCAALGASFLRSTLTHSNVIPVPQTDRALYYQNQPICQYAKIIHKYGIKNHAFCYGYDEVAGDAGENRDVVNPTSLKLTVNAIA